MKALGLHAGIGAMLIAFHRRKEWDVMGNLETRKIHTFRDEKGRNTFEDYFDAPIFNLLEDIPLPSRGVDLVAGQPKCGGFSSLFGTSRKQGDNFKTPKDYGEGIHHFIDGVQMVSPAVFYMDNLAKSLLVVGADAWAEALPDYHLQFEWVSNFHYGNPQKARNRLFVIGVHRDLNFRFTPQEDPDSYTTVRDRIADLGECPNHDEHSGHVRDNITNLAPDNTWESIAEWIVENVPPGKNLPYLAKDGTIKTRIGSNVMYWDKHAHTLAGVKGAKFHPHTGYPLSIRERCRLQGYPDDFIIRGTRYGEDGTWALGKNSNVVRQLNNTVPYEFTEEFCRQLTYYMKTGYNMELEPCHAIKPNELVEKANAYISKLS